MKGSGIEELVAAATADGEDDAAMGDGDGDGDGEGDGYEAGDDASSIKAEKGDDDEGEEVGGYAS